MAEPTERTRIAIRANLRACAKALGLPDGYAPSQPRYSAWAREHGRTRAHRMARASGFVEPGCTIRWPAMVRWALLRPMSELGRLHLPVEETKQAIVEDIRRVARELGHPDRVPSPKAYRKHGLVHECTAKARLTGDRQGSWHDVALAAGLMPSRRRNGSLSRAEVIKAYRRVARELRIPGGEEGPTSTEFTARTGIHHASTRKWFPLWRDLAEAAGYRSRPAGVRVGERARRVA